MRTTTSFGIFKLLYLWTTILVKVIRDGQGASRGFGFVYYVSLEDALRGIEDWNGKYIVDRPMIVRFSQESVRFQATNKILVKKVGRQRVLVLPC